MNAELRKLREQDRSLTELIKMATMQLQMVHVAMLRINTEEAKLAEQRQKCCRGLTTP